MPGSTRDLFQVKAAGGIRELPEVLVEPLERGSGVPPLNQENQQSRDGSATLEDNLPIQVRDALAGSFFATAINTSEVARVSKTGSIVGCCSEIVPRTGSASPHCSRE